MSSANFQSCGTIRKKLAYIWEYYRWKIIAVFALILFACFLWKDLRSGNQHDFSIVMVSQYSYTEELCERQAKRFQEIAALDGQKELDIGLRLILLTNSQEKTYYDAILQTQLMIELTEGKGSLLLLDDHALDIIRAYSESYLSSVVEVPEQMILEEIHPKLYLAQKADSSGVKGSREESEFYSNMIHIFETI